MDFLVLASVAIMHAKQYRCRCCQRKPLYKNTWRCNTCYEYCCQHCIGWNGHLKNCTQCTEKQKNMGCCTKANQIDNTDEVTNIEESDEEVPDDTDERRKKKRNKRYQCRCCKRKPLYKNTWKCNTCYEYCCQFCLGWNGHWKSCTQCTE